MHKSQMVEISDTYPLSPMQQGMLFHYLSEPNSGGDLEQVVCSLTESLNVLSFRTAWEKVVSRHAVLRTSFRWEKLPEPLQDVHREGLLPFLERDWTKLSSSEQDSEMNRYLAADRRLGFDLSKGPNLRVMVARVAENVSKCVWSFHHILLDGRSFPIVLNEVFAIYDALCRGENLQLPSPRPFRDHIDWLQAQDWTRSEAFWRDKMKGFTVATNLRMLKPVANADDQTFSRGERALSIPETMTSLLKAFAATNGVTLNTLVQGAWAILLSRYSGEEDVVFGTTRACRQSTISDANSVVGIFINTLPLRVLVPPTSALTVWLKEVRNQEFDLRKHEQTPLFKIQQWSEVTNRKTLFDSLIMFDHAQLNTLLAKSQLGRNREFHLHEQVGYPLVLQAYGQDQLLLKCGYNRAIFVDDTILRMLGHLSTILAGMVAAPEKAIGQLQLLTEPERKQILYEWNAPQFDCPGNECIHYLVEKQVARTPDALALSCDGHSLTYRQLNSRANRLARELRAMGVGPDVLVGICMERSNDLVISLLAILKAGGAYLPIDLTYPADRLAFMLADANAPVLLTQSKLTQDLPKTAAKVVCVDELLSQSTSISDDDNLHSSVKADNLAYVIYTSGTTGKPKGTCITHRNVTRLFSATDHWYHFNQDDVWSFFHSYAFDFSVWEIWGALLYGGRVVVVPYMASRSPEAFYKLLASERVTILNQTPSAFRQLIQAEESVGPDKLALRYVIFGGEALEMQSLRPWFERHGDHQPRLVNMYGITETTVHVTCRPLSKDDLCSGSVIGVPIPDLQVYILDSQRQLLPIGVPGEMYVGGAGLARGYLNRPDLTDERFIPDHITGRPGSRLYKTGDLARFLPGRDIEYLGRIDSQVKIRGFRIELGEIESVLCQHTSIREAVVLAREDTLLNKRLVAYVVAGGSAPSVKDLREHLKKKVPEYMVPSAFVYLQKIPLTTNGKVDRKALPEPDLDRPDLGSKYVPPRTEAEREVCRVFSKVLGVEQISIHDDFFDLGGHSLMVLRAISLINDRFKSDLSPVALFEHRSVARLCSILEAGSQDRTTVSLLENPKNGRQFEISKVDLASMAAITAQLCDRASPTAPGLPCRMRESWICKWILAPLYWIRSGNVKRLMQYLILKFEGDEMFTVTLRKLYARYYDIQVGNYSTVLFDVNRLRNNTKIGRYSSISPTVLIQNADHPRNTISTHALFYHPAFKFAEGYELTRVQVEIGNDVFIGHNAMILYPTKKIGDGAVIAAGSIVVEDVPPYAIVGGYPATILRYRFSKETIAELLKSQWWDASLEQLGPVKECFARPLEGNRIL